MDGTPDLERPLIERAETVVTACWGSVKSAYTVYRRQVWEARLRYANQQWLDWDNDRRMFKRAQPADREVPTPNINRVGPWFDGIASNFANVPEIEAVATPKDDPVKMGIAEVINKLCDHTIKDNALRSDFGSREDRNNTASQMFTMGGCVFSVVRMEQKEIGRKPLMTTQPTYSSQCLTCGAAFPDLPEEPAMCPQCHSQQMTVEHGEIEVPQMGEDSQPMTEAVTQPRVMIEIDDPVWMGPRPGARAMDDTGWITCARRLTVEDIEQRTGVKATADSEYPDAMNTGYQNELNYWYLGYSAATNAQQDSALFVEFWCEPGKKKDLPEGAYCTYFNGKVQTAVAWTELGLQTGDHPITKGDFDILAGIFFPRAKAFDLCAIQWELTMLDSNIHLHFKTNATEPIVAEKRSTISEITGYSDQVIWWQAYAPNIREPHRMAHGNLDPQIYERVKYLEQRGESIASTVSVFRGEQPGSVTAASAISQLRGQAEQQFARPTKNYNNFWKETIRKTMPFYQKYPLNELAEICGKDKLTQIQDFKQADLNKSIEFIATSHGLPRTRDERRQEMMLLFDKGALDTNDPDVQQKIFDLFGDTGMMNKFNADATRARMNVRLAKDRGIAGMFRPGIDDANIHNAIATEAAKILDFDRWPPPSQQALIAYIGQVQGFLQQQAAAEAEAARPQPKPGGPAKPAATEEPTHV